jgi:PKD repeat protein
MTYLSEVAGPRVDTMVKKNTITVVVVVVIVLIAAILAIVFVPKLVDSIRGGGGGGGGGGGNDTEPIVNKAPTAILKAEKEIAREQEGITFDGNESFDIDYTGNLTNKGIFHYVWNWGDGTDEETTINGTEIHSFAEQGFFTVTLTVVDEEGARDTDNVTIQIVPQDLFISSSTQPLIGEALVPGINVIGNTTETNWTIKKNAKVMNITVTVTGFYAQEMSENSVEILLYNPYENILANETLEVMGTQQVNWDFEEMDIALPGDYYVFIHCYKGAAFVSVEGTVSYLG